MCGIVGIYNSPKAPEESYLALLMLQHRGQDSAGIFSFDQESHSFYGEKNLGHIKEALPENQIINLKGNCAIAHTRYSTIGKIRKEEIQPMIMNYPYGIIMAHNGNIINSNKVGQELREKKRRMVLSKNDLEVMMNIFAENLSKPHDVLSFDEIKGAVKEVHNSLKGAYSTVSYIADQGMVAFKDPFGIRPLVWGKRKLTEEEKDLNKNDHDYSYAVASESKSLEFLGYEDIQELKQGQLLYFAKDGNIYSEVLSELLPRPCMFEWIYFANADSSIWDRNVYQVRLELGKHIGQKIKELNWDIDTIVPVPDTSRPSAITIAEELAKPYREVLIKNRYAQRTFILNTQKDREKAVSLKMNVVKEEVQGKNILLVDDSIVRGTTSKKIINLLRKNGAKSVYIVSTCPKIVSPCFYGIDFPSDKELVSFNRNESQIAETIGADGVYFCSLTDFKKIFGKLNTCRACLDGEYPVDIKESKTMISSRVEYEKTNLPGLC